MDKDKLIKMKKRLLATGLAGIMLVTTGCEAKKDENGVPLREAIPQKYYDIEGFYKYVVQDGKAVKQYNSENVYLLFNKETYEANEYIYSHVFYNLGAELYDLETEELLAYNTGIATDYNEAFFKYLVENNYQVCLNEVGNYVEGHVAKDYYSLDEIRELEPQIEKSLRIINEEKTKTKKKTK